MAALTCEDILKMVKYNLPENTIINTMKSSAAGMPPNVAKCLKKNGAPSAIVDLASELSSSSEPEERSSEPKKRTMDDDEDFRSRADEAIPERGESSGSQPSEIREARNKLKAKKPLTASFLLFKLLEDKTYPKYETDINYYLGRSLEALKMYHAAQHHYLKVIQAGPSTQYFNSALPNLVKISRYTADDYDLKRIVAKLNPKYFPRRAKSQLHYLLGVRKYKQGELAEAQASFSKVSSKSILYLKSRYFEGVIHNERGKLKSAVCAF
jgi:tetratricopeptide (TPR) repeat protein